MPKNLGSDYRWVNKGTQSVIIRFYTCGCLAHVNLPCFSGVCGGSLGLWRETDRGPDDPSGARCFNSVAIVGGGIKKRSTSAY